jgi:hypothetical protein
MGAEIERLRGENTLLRQRLAAVETLALEREGTIEDLRNALQMLPAVWAERVGGRLEAGVGEADRPGLPPPGQPPTRHAEATNPQAPSAAGRVPAPAAAVGDQEEVFFAEIAALRLRLERKRLEAEQEILEQERRRLLADTEWTQKWQRSRGLRPASD